MTRGDSEKILDAFDKLDRAIQAILTAQIDKLSERGAVLDRRRLELRELLIATHFQQPWEGRCLDCGRRFETPTSQCPTCAKPLV